jgi:hypothetical protein
LVRKSKMQSPVLAERFCDAVVINYDMSNATARIGAWMIGAAKQVGGFPLELSLRQISEGFTVGRVTVKGTGSRLETIKAALEWLEQEGLLKIEEGGHAGFGKHSRVYHMEL